MSGNPAGRPKCEAVALRQSLADGASGVVEAVLLAAQCGDMQAAKIVLDRIIPPLKSATLPVHVTLADDQSPLAIARAVLEAAAAGTLPPDIAAQLVTAAGTLARVEEVEELRDRLAALEKALTPPTANKSKP
ncbi:MAG: hypothetical protein Q8Q59_07735 [Luteolibacter sp.]|nr:hypothetical protein [Luteolibacter sp.]